MMFVFVLSRREWTAPGGSKSVQLWEARCIPGNLIGTGKTPQEAEQKLKGLIEWTTEEEQAETWYRTSWASASDTDRQFFDGFVGRLVRTLQKPKTINERISYDRASYDQAGSGAMIAACV